MWLSLPPWRQGVGGRQPPRRGVAGKLALLRLEERANPAISFAVGSGPGMSASVNVYDENAALIGTIMPYMAMFTGGVNVALGDVTGDGVPDIVTGAGPSGGPHVKVFDGAGFLGGVTQELISFMAYDINFTGGVYVACGDIDDPAGEEPIPFPDADTRAEIVTGAGAGGGPHVEAFKFNPDGTNQRTILSFNAYDQSFKGGVRVALGDFGGANGGVAGSKTLGDNEIATAPGPGGGPHVRLWDYDGEEFMPDNFANIIADIGPGFTGGLFVSAGYFTNNRDSDGFIYEDVVISAGPGGQPHTVTYRLDSFVDVAQRNVGVYVLASTPAGTNDNGTPEDVTPNDFAT